MFKQIALRVGVALGACLVLYSPVFIVSGCTPETQMVVKGDRSVVQVSAGQLKAGDGDSRAFYILRDPDTGIDYLAVVDAGIIELKPKPALVVEQPKR